MFSVMIRTRFYSATSLGARPASALDGALPRQQTPPRGEISALAAALAVWEPIFGQLRFLRGFLFCCLIDETNGSIVIHFFCLICATFGCTRAIIVPTDFSRADRSPLNPIFIHF